MQIESENFVLSLCSALQKSSWSFGDIVGLRCESISVMNKYIEKM